MKLLAVAVMFFISLIGNPMQILANEAQGVPFSVQAILPENQANSKATYFDIEMEVGQTQELEVVITNVSEEPIQVAVESHAAATNSNGVISYDGSVDMHHESMKYPFDAISEIEESPVEVPANSQVTVAVPVTAPNESFDGQILGGLYFKLMNENDDTQEGLSIQNEYSYVIGVNITEAENDTVVEPELEFESVGQELVNYRPAIQTTFNNTTPVLVGQLNFLGEVYNAADTENPVATREQSSFSIAPNAKFHFPIYLENNEPLEPGDYIFRGKVTGEESEWTFEEAFTIEEEPAE